MLNTLIYKVNNTFNLSAAKERHGIYLLVISYIAILFSSPMPIDLGWNEFVMGLGIVFSNIILWVLIISNVKNNSRFHCLLMLLLYMLLMPLFFAFYYEYSFINIIRDYIPILFITVIPFLWVYTYHLNNSINVVNVLLFCILTVGVVSAFQFIYMLELYLGGVGRLTSGLYDIYTGVNIAVINESANTGSNVYSKALLKVVDPSVMFSAIFLLSFGFKKILLKDEFFLGMLALILGGVCAFSLAIISLRANFGLIVIFVFISFIQVAKINKNMYLIAGIIVASVTVLYIGFYDAILTMYAKQASVGGNGKLAEFISVLNVVGDSTRTFLFGIGWGGELLNPIYDFNPTRFTHSLISFLLLKSGVVGLILLVSFFIALMPKVSFRRLYLGEPDRMILFLSSLAPLLIGVFLQPTYKMLSYGFIISLMFVSFNNNNEVAGST